MPRSKKEKIVSTIASRYNPANGLYVLNKTSSEGGHLGSESVARVYSHWLRGWDVSPGFSKSAIRFSNNTTFWVRILFFSANREVITVKAKLSRTRKRSPKKNNAFEGMENPNRLDIQTKRLTLMDNNKKRPPVTIHKRAYRSLRYFLRINSRMKSNRMKDPIMARGFAWGLII